MTIEALLSKDFSALARRLDADAFAERILRKIRDGERRRLFVVGGAGALGAAIAATQFHALAGALREAMPSLADIALADRAATLDIGAAPMALAALLFALAGGATALIAPGSR